MSTQPDGVNDLLSRDLQAAMAVAGRWGEMMARQRAEQVRQRVMEQQHRRRELQERFEAERSVMRTWSSRRRCCCSVARWRSYSARWRAIISPQRPATAIAA